MRLKHILEYDDSDIRDLLGDLDSIGQTKNYVGTLWARFHTYRLLDDYWSKSPEYMCFLKTEPFYGTGDEDRDNAIMLQKIQSGNFFRPNDPDARSWASLKKGNPMVVDFLEKRKVQSLAKTCSTMDELVDQIRENLVKEQVFIDISDTGGGIPRLKFEAVFQPGYTTRKRGWGLGLSLTKRIVENYHQGSVFVKESEIGKGTTFRIVLNSNLTYVPTTS
jgi:hypothetical protein